MKIKRSQDDPSILYVEHPEIPKGSGTFVMKRLSVIEQIDFNIRKAAFLGGGAASPEHATLASALAHCVSSFKSVPDGFEAGSVFDTDLIVALAKEVEAYHASFRQSVVPKAG